MSGMHAADALRIVLREAEDSYELWDAMPSNAQDPLLAVLGEAIRIVRDMQEIEQADKDANHGG